MESMAKSSDKHAEPSEDEDGAQGGRRHGAPGVVAPSSRVNVAFPFSQIKLEEPSKELSDLAGIVLDLITSMAEWIPEERLAELRSRAKSVHDSLR